MADVTAIDVICCVNIDDSNMLVKQRQTHHFETKVSFSAAWRTANFDKFVWAYSLVLKTLIQLVNTRVEMLKISHFRHKLLKAVYWLNTSQKSRLSINARYGVLCNVFVFNFAFLEVFFCCGEEVSLILKI